MGRGHDKHRFAQKRGSDVFTLEGSVVVPRTVQVPAARLLDDLLVPVNCRLIALGFFVGTSGKK